VRYLLTLYLLTAGSDDYTLQGTSQAMTKGDPVYGAQMGAYGGADPIAW